MKADGCANADVPKSNIVIGSPGGSSVVVSDLMGIGSC
jgi:hypothetical protein